MPDRSCWIVFCSFLSYPEEFGGGGGGLGGCLGGCGGRNCCSWSCGNGSSHTNASGIYWTTNLWNIIGKSTRKTFQKLSFLFRYWFLKEIT